MKHFKYLIVFIGLISFFILGCSNKIENEEKVIKVQKSIGNEEKHENSKMISNEEQIIKVQKNIVSTNNYEDFKMISNKKQVQKVKEILEDSEWEYVVYDRGDISPYRFSLQYKNPDIKTKIICYQLWIFPNNLVQLVVNGDFKSTVLDENKSAEIHEILIGEK